MTLREILEKVYASDTPGETLSVLITNYSNADAENIYNAASFAVGNFDTCYPLPFFECSVQDYPHLHVEAHRFDELIAILEACA